MLLMSDLIPDEEREAFAVFYRNGERAGMNNNDVLKTLKEGDRVRVSHDDYGAVTSTAHKAEAYLYLPFGLGWFDLIERSDWCGWSIAKVEAD